MELVAVVKRDCETCQLVEPVLAELRNAGSLTLYSQDDPDFPESLGGARDDTALEQSWRLEHRKPCRRSFASMAARKPGGSKAGTGPNGNAFPA